MWGPQSAPLWILPAAPKAPPVECLGWTPQYSLLYKISQRGPGAGSGAASELRLGYASPSAVAPQPPRTWTRRVGGPKPAPLFPLSLSEGSTWGATSTFTASPHQPLWVETAPVKGTSKACFRPQGRFQVPRHCFPGVCGRGCRGKGGGWSVL